MSLFLFSSSSLLYLKIKPKSANIKFVFTFPLAPRFVYVHTVTIPSTLKSVLFWCHYSLSKESYHGFNTIKTDWSVNDFSCVLYYKVKHGLFHLSKTIPRIEIKDVRSLLKLTVIGKEPSYMAMLLFHLFIFEKWFISSYRWNFFTTLDSVPQVFLQLVMRLNLWGQRGTQVHKKDALGKL